MKKRKGAKGKSTAAAKSKAKKKAKEDGEYEGSSEDEYTAISKNLWSMGGSGDPKPPVGSFEKCVRCEKQFTVVITGDFYRDWSSPAFFVPRRNIRWQRIRHLVTYVTSVRRRLGLTRSKSRPLLKRENQHRKDVK